MMKDENCPLCQNDPPKTHLFFEGDFIIVRDLNLDGAKDRLLCYVREHVKSVPTVTRLRMQEALMEVAVELAGIWTIEETLRSVPDHYHIHARRVQ